MAERLMAHWGKGRFKAYSAGSYPAGQVHPFAIQTLQARGLSTDGVRSKSWNEFSAEGAPYLDFIFTVCDNAVGEVCPIWPGHPMTAHWGVQDPVAVQGSDAEKLIAFHRICNDLENRIKLFAELPLHKIDKMKIKQEIDAIGEA